MSEMTIQEAVRMMSEQMANMYYYLTREMVNALGKEEAKKYIHKAIVDFGHNRGERIAAKALAAGDELTIENLDKYYDIPIAQGWDLHRTYNKDFKDNVTDSCIFAEVWIEKDWAEIGHLYCAVDIAIREGYSKNIKFIPVKNILLGDPHCQSKTIYCKNKEEQNNG